MPEQPYARFGLAIVRLTIGAMFVVGLLREFRERALHTRRLRRLDQLLHPTRSRSGHLEGHYGYGGESLSDGSAASGHDGNFAGRASASWPSHAPRWTCRMWFAREPMGVGVGHVVDLGTTGSYAGSAGDRGGSGGPDVGD